MPRMQFGQDSFSRKPGAGTGRTNPEESSGAVRTVAAHQEAGGDHGKRPSRCGFNGHADLRKALEGEQYDAAAGQAEEDVATGRTRSMRTFLQEFKHAHNISR